MCFQSFLFVNTPTTTRLSMHLMRHLPEWLSRGTGCLARSQLPFALQLGAFPLHSLQFSVIPIFAPTLVQQSFQLHQSSPSSLFREFPRAHSTMSSLKSSKSSDLSQIPALKPPSGLVPNLHNPRGLGTTIITVNSVFLALMTLTLIARIYAKGAIVRSLWWDDRVLLPPPCCIIF